MNCYEVKYSKNAEKFIKKNKIVGIKFLKAFNEIATKKEKIKDYDIKKYRSKYDNVFRLRIGSYRAVFSIVDEKILIFVFNIGSRGDVYKDLNL